ncbi:tRNA lysidine(34) synthetase TilS [Humibacter albus]|uniref:tRNA lysidine(34) synthetase TilS n=1 Tax=Humibacter albus TaxID=427754 RepID=UPI0003B74CC3|nr:tRNA lysidine(34) synthetase TilS [Humibacter albus]
MEPRRPRLTPPIADIRRAVREGLAAAGVAEGDLVLVGLSGGGDSLALAAGAAFEGPRAGIRVGAVIVDHGLQDASASAAERAREQAVALGLAPVVVTRVQVADAAAAGGPEKAAREARYAAFTGALADTGATHLLLAHTLDDQAETVLLGLARGSGATSLQGMAPRSDLHSEVRAGGRGAVLRPLLGIRRETTRQACRDAGLTMWDDPQNLDPSYARVRARQNVLPVLERELGPGVAEALARTADQLREDAQAFDEMIEEVIEDICEPAEAGIAVSVRALEANPAALRNRIIRHVVFSEFGVALERVHVLAVARLVTDWHGQKALDLPGGVRASRAGGHIVFSTTGATRLLPHDH